MVTKIKEKKNFITTGQAGGFQKVEEKEKWGRKVLSTHRQTGNWEEINSSTGKGEEGVRGTRESGTRRNGFDASH